MVARGGNRGQMGEEGQKVKKKKDVNQAYICIFIYTHIFIYTNVYDIGI